MDVRVVFEIIIRYAVPTINFNWQVKIIENVQEFTVEGRICISFSPTNTVYIPSDYANCFEEIIPLYKETEYF